MGETLVELSKETQQEVQDIIGTTILAKGSVTSVPHVIIELPAKFRAFSVSIQNARIQNPAGNPGDSFACAFSIDGGQHYLYGGNTYWGCGVVAVWDAPNGLNPAASVGAVKPLMDLGTIDATFALATTPIFGFDAELFINPGSATETPRLRTSSISASIPAATRFCSTRADWFVAGALSTPPVVIARVTHVLIQVLGDGVVPHAGPLIAKMDYAAYGIA